MDIKEKLKEINRILKSHNWLDMEILGWKGSDLTLIGSMDFTYGHQLEIIFKDISFLSINSEWQMNCQSSEPLICLVEGNESFDINSQYQIEYGNFLFKIIPENLDAVFYISAKKMEFNTDSVLYYKKDKLDTNERIASWVVT